MTISSDKERAAKRQRSTWIPPYLQGHIRTLANKGMTRGDIAAELGVQPEAVRRVLSSTTSAQEEQQT